MSLKYAGKKGKGFRKWVDKNYRLLKVFLGLDAVLVGLAALMK